MNREQWDQKRIDRTTAVTTVVVQPDFARRMAANMSMAAVITQAANSGHYEVASCCDWAIIDETTSQEALSTVSPAPTFGLTT